MAPRLAVQVVLLGARKPRISRLVGAVGACARRARESGRADEVALLLGDRSPEALLSANDVAEMADRALARGLSDLLYEQLDPRTGYAGGHNRLARPSTAEVIVILDEDAYPSPPLVDRLLSALDGPSVGIADARQVPLEHPKAYDHSTGDTAWASAACLALRRSTFEAVAGFDDASFSREGADVDLSWRILMLGQRAVHAPGAVVFCGRALTTGESFPRRGPGDRDQPAGDYEALLAHLLLATKASREDVVASTLEQVEERGGSEERRAAGEFSRLQAAGLLPYPYRDVTAATFVGRAYALHRF